MGPPRRRHSFSSTLFRSSFWELQKRRRKEEEEEEEVRLCFSQNLIFQGIFCLALVKCQCGTKNTLKNQGVAPGTKLREHRKCHPKSAGTLKFVRPETSNLREITRKNEEKGNKKREREERGQNTQTSPQDKPRNKPETFQGDAVTNHKWPKMVEITSNLVQLHNRRISLPTE